ncbi:MAG: histidine--tRNA ligase [Simkaniaceae bacterium]|nr:histidine--tRNA ligase [Candidatus Sacchlamyda saccharinae]
MKYAIAKGVFDVLPKDPTQGGEWRLTHLWHYLEEQIHRLAKAYGYREIRTPIFERTELFVRGVGESSDIVTKEMYTFEDRAGRMMTLRPEGTAAIMRAYVEKRLDQQIGCQKLYYIGPMFRYERPQAGRYRQHHQFGVEAIGDASPEQDVEVIDMLCEFYRRLGLKNLTVMLNSVGDDASRESFRAALRKFLEPHFDALSEESKIRYEKNVLRILDSKDPNDQKLLLGAPSLHDFLGEEAKEHFARVQALLKKLGIHYVVTPNLVRGLDYYTKTVFEVTSGELGAQNAIGAGGRYDGLTALLGGPDLPSIGFAAGLERILQTMIAQKIPLPEPPHPALYIVPLGEKAKEYGLELTYRLRHQDVGVEIDCHAKKVGKALEKAVALGATYALVLGEDELSSGEIKLKKIASREELPLKLDDLEKFLLGKG